MVVLWICNVPTEDASQYNKGSLSSSGGWLTGYINAIKHHSTDVSVVYCYPRIGQKDIKSFTIDGIKYYEFYAPKKYGVFDLNANCDDGIVRKNINSIIECEKPDIIHVWGTEFYHSLIAIEENTVGAKIVCSIQGLVSEIAKYYLKYVPASIYRQWSFSCLIRGTLARQQKNLIKRGAVEEKIIKKCNYIIGRTEWDQAVVKSINPHCIYFSCNETMRDEFYKRRWSYNNCITNSLFISQGSSPLKGLNIAVEALNILQNRYPDIRLNIAGTNFIKQKTFKEKITISTYGRYIRKLIERYSLGNKVTFLGPLGEKEMVEEYLKCNVFLSCSSIENSSNSISEAMLLGVPIVSSYVGGVPTLINDKVNGLMYQGDSSIMLAHNIEKMLMMKEKASYFGNNAREKGLVTHNQKYNNDRLVEIYRYLLDC